MIELVGLTPLQRDLAEKIWQIEDQEHLVEFVKSLPRSVAQHAYVVIQLMLLEAWDDEDLGDMAEARELLRRVNPC
jgi:hypothetical protein